MPIRPRPALDTSGPACPSVTVFIARAVPESGRALPADKLSLPVLSQLAAVVYQEAARAGELVRLPRDHAEGKLLIGQIGARELQRLRHVIGVDVNRARRLVHPAGLEFLQAVFCQVLVCLSRAVIVGGHPTHPPPLSCLVARW